MQKTAILPRDFYARDTLIVARELLGARLVHVENGERISGIIIETEAYCGEGDFGCHAIAGRTKRTEAMYGPPGLAYIYFTYGNHWLFNAVTRPEGHPEAVLVRALLPAEGIEHISKRRAPQPQARWTDGPGKLTQALGINGDYNRVDLTTAEGKLFIENAYMIPEHFVTTGSRIGLFTVPEPWKSKPWRFIASLPINWLEKEGEQ